jgi:hypothetical protein
MTWPAIAIIVAWMLFGYTLRELLRARAEIRYLRHQWRAASEAYHALAQQQQADAALEGAGGE